MITKKMQKIHKQKEPMFQKLTIKSQINSQNFGTEEKNNLGNYINLNFKKLKQLQTGNKKDQLNGCFDKKQKQSTKIKKPTLQKQKQKQQNDQKEQHHLNIIPTTSKRRRNSENNVFLKRQDEQQKLKKDLLNKKKKSKIEEQKKKAYFQCIQAYQLEKLKGSDDQEDSYEVNKKIIKRNPILQRFRQISISLQKKRSKSQTIQQNKLNFLEDINEKLMNSKTQLSIKNIIYENATHQNHKQKQVGVQRKLIQNVIRFKSEICQDRQINFAQVQFQDTRTSPLPFVSDRKIVLSTTQSKVFSFEGVTNIFSLGQTEQKQL